MKFNYLSLLSLYLATQTIALSIPARMYMIKHLQVTTSNKNIQEQTLLAATRLKMALRLPRVGSDLLTQQSLLAVMRSRTVLRLPKDGRVV